MHSMARDWRASHVRRRTPLLLSSLLLILAFEGSCDCIQFDDVATGTRYNVGDSFSSSGTQVTVKDFQWGNGGGTSDGFAEVDSQGRSGGSKQDMHTNNANLSFDVGEGCEGLSLVFGDYGGNENIEINGDFHVFNEFSEIDGIQIGGVDVTVSITTSDVSKDLGTLTLSGTINSFAIGGQELWIDDVCCRD